MSGLSGVTGAAGKKGAKGKSSVPGKSSSPVGGGAPGGGGASESGGGGGCSPTIPTIINIPVPRIKETELEVVHVFPQGFPGGGMGGGGGGGGYGQSYGYGSPYGTNLIPSYSVTSQINGSESTNNFWGFNPRKVL